MSRPQRRQASVGRGRTRVGVAARLHPACLQDQGSMMTVDAFIAASILMMSFVFILPPANHQDEAVQQAYGVATEDSLEAVRTAMGDGGPGLDALVAHVLLCDAAPPPQGCPAEPPQEVRIQLKPYLPPGARSVVWVGNGIAERKVGPETAPHGPVASVAVLHAPAWAHVAAVTDLDCYGSGMPVRVTAFALRNGNPWIARSVEVATPTQAWNATRAPGEPAWLVDVPAAARPAAGSLSVAAALPGARDQVLPYRSCALGTESARLQEALREATLRVEGEASPGATVRLAYDVAPILVKVPGARIDRLAVEIHSPARLAGASPPAANLTLPLFPSGAASWTVPSTAAQGVHPVVLRVGLAIPAASGEVAVEARVAATMAVGMPGIPASFEPLYRVTLQAWDEGWA